MSAFENDLNKNLSHPEFAKEFVAELRRVYVAEMSKLEDALDAANAKLGRIEVALVAPTDPQTAVELIREVVNNGP